MALFDRFIKKQRTAKFSESKKIRVDKKSVALPKEKKEKELGKTREQKEKVISPELKEKAGLTKELKKQEKKEVVIASRVLKSPQITEKASLLQKSNQYVFKVYDSATKPEIKKAVEEVYRVNVLGVRIIRIPRKQRRLGRSKGWRKGYKKAIVVINKGQEIEMIPR